MRVFVNRLIQNVYTPCGWTIITIVLLCIPGSAIPKLDGFNIKYLDKIVHFFLFGTLVILWCFYVASRTVIRKRDVISITLGAIALGVLLEFVQFYFIAYRDFDQLDILANSLGALAFAAIFLSFFKTQNFTGRPS